MNEFSSAKVSLSDPAAKNVTTVTLTLPSNEIVIDNRQLQVFVKVFWIIHLLIQNYQKYKHLKLFIQADFLVHSVKNCWK